MKHVHLYFLAALAVVALCVGGWFAYWGLAGSSQDHRYNIDTHSREYQSGLVSQERDRVLGYDSSTSGAQRHQIELTFCQVYPDLTQPPADLEQAHSRICQP